MMATQTTWANPEQWAGPDPDQEATEYIVAAIRRRLTEQDRRVKALESLAYSQGVLLAELSEKVRQLSAQLEEGR